jgi:hypothetical protein
METIQKIKRAHCPKTKGSKLLWRMIFKKISKTMFKMNKLYKMNLITSGFMKTIQTSMIQYLQWATIKMRSKLKDC